VTENAHTLAEPFRNSLRGLAASVTIISTQTGGVRYGMVATAVMSLSMEPPSLVLAVNSAASIHGPMKRRNAFVVNILSEWDERVARGFASMNGENRFAFGAWSARRAGPTDTGELPYLANAQATIFCRIKDAHQSGSHSLFIGEVQDVILGKEKAPLLYCDGTYGAFAAGAPHLAVSRSA
jgi:flavin reductase